MGTQCLHEARLPLFNRCSERTQCRPRVQHPDRRVCFLERHYRLNCAIKKQSSKQRESAARLTGPRELSARPQNLPPTCRCGTRHMQSTTTLKFSGMMWKADRIDYDGPVGLQLSLALMSVPSSLLLTPAVLDYVKNAGTEEEHSEVRPDSGSSFHIHNLPTSSREHLSDKKEPWKNQCSEEESMHRGGAGNFLIACATITTGTSTTRARSSPGRTALHHDSDIHPVDRLQDRTVNRSVQHAHTSSVRLDLNKVDIVLCPNWRRTVRQKSDGSVKTDCGATDATGTFTT